MEKIDLVGLVSNDKIGTQAFNQLGNSPSGLGTSPPRELAESKDGMQSNKLIEAHKDSDYAAYLVQHTKPAVNQVLKQFEATSEVGRKRQTEVLDYII